MAAKALENAATVRGMTDARKLGRGRLMATFGALTSKTIVRNNETQKDSFGFADVIVDDGGDDNDDDDDDDDDGNKTKTDGKGSGSKKKDTEFSCSTGKNMSTADRMLSETPLKTPSKTPIRVSNIPGELHMCVFVFVCLCVCVCVCLGLRICARACVCVCVSVCVFGFANMRACVCM